MKARISKRILRRNTWFIGLFALIGGALVVRSFAAISPNAKVAEAESYSSQTYVAVISDSSASGTSYAQFDVASTGGGGGTCSGAANTPGGSDGKGSCFPGPNNTGYKNAPDCQGVQRTTFTGTLQSNTTYKCMDFPGGIFVGSSSADINNVTFYGCWFHGVNVGGALVALFGNNITFDYSSFTPNVSAPPVAYNQSYQYGIAANGGYYSHVGKLTVRNSDFWGFGNAIDITGSTQTGPHVFEHNYIHDAAEDGGGQYHTDGIGDESGAGKGSYVVLHHNTIESVGNTNGVAFQQGVYSNFTVTDNLFGGFGYTVAIWAPAPNTIFTGNTFSTRIPAVYGPLYPQSFWTSSGSVWKCNKWAVPDGATSGNPAQDGWYWIPQSDPSQTDYQGNTTCP